MSLFLVWILLGAPKIQVDQTLHDFGEVQEGQAAVHIFHIRNVGDKDLEIRNVRTSCGCTAALLSDRVIPPGGETQLKVTYRTRGRPGPFRKSVTLFTNDPEAPTFQLLIKGVVKAVPRPKAVLIPPVVNLGRVAPGSETPFTLQLANKGDLPLEVEKIETGALLIPESPLQEPLFLRPGEALPLNFRFRAPRGEKLVEDFVTVYSNDPRRPRVFVKVIAQVGGAP